MGHIRYRRSTRPLRSARNSWGYTEMQHPHSEAQVPRREPNWLGLLLTVILLAGFALAIIGIR